MLNHFTDADVPDQTGKTFLITGANTGIGFEAAKVLAARGARVRLGCRSTTKAQEAVAEIRKEVPQAELDVVELDLADLASVRRAAEVVAKEPALDGLINNAGIMMPPRQLTQDGFESQFGVNHLGHFALTGLLLPTVQSTPNSRIVNVSSNAHKGGAIDFDDLEASRSYSKLGRYSMSKLANLLHVYELDRRLRASGSTTMAVAVHPGGADTDLGRHLSPTVAAILLPVARLFINTRVEGAWPTLMGATCPDVEGGQYFGPSGLMQIKGPAKRVDSNERSRDPQLAARLWDVSVELTKVEPRFSSTEQDT